MRAVLQSGYGGFDRLSLGDAPDPTPGPDEALVRVRATSVHADVWHMVTGLPYAMRLFGGGLLRPKTPIPGTDMAGVVEAVGASVTRLAPGDAVFGETTPLHQWCNGGTLAELVTASADRLEPMPANLTFAEAASVPTSGLIALMNMRDGGRPEPGHEVLVNGAGGAVGVFAVQVAALMGGRVTAVDRTDKLDALRDLGAATVIDYTAEDVLDRRERYDLVFDVASSLPYRRVPGILREGGRYVMIGHSAYDTRARWVGSLARFFGLLLRTPFDRHLGPLDFEMGRPDDLATLADHILAGELRPVLGPVFPLAEVHAALECLVRGDAFGRIVVEVDRADERP